MLVDPKSCDASSGIDLEHFLGELREWLGAGSPNLLPLFDVFAQEARFARRWLSPSLEHLSAGSKILEVGAGLLLVSCQLQREGFSVVALEPIGIGFSAFAELQGVVLKFATERGFAPEIIPAGIEEFEADSRFAFAFSVNVMEHVRSVPLALERVSEALEVGGEYRFTCPNYWFPYEPHFNIPTLFSKRLTQRVFRNAICRSTRVSDPQGTWESLNWINVNQIRRIVAKLFGMNVAFDGKLLACTLERVATDPDFANRRSAWMRALIKALVKSGAYRIARIVPVALQPIIDCRIKRTGSGVGV